MVEPNEKRKFYFVTDIDFGESYSILPKIPLNRKFEENDDVPRICVAPTVYGCLAAIENIEIGGCYRVYECESSDYCRPSEDDVEDVEFTDEHWILSSTVIKLNCLIKVIEREFIKIKNNTDIHIAFKYKEIER